MDIYTDKYVHVVIKNVNVQYNYPWVPLHARFWPRILPISPHTAVRNARAPSRFAGRGGRDFLDLFVGPRPTISRSAAAEGP